MTNTVVLMCIKDLYSLGPGSQPVGAEVVASTLSRHADPYRMDALDSDLGAVVQAAGEWRGDFKPRQGLLSKLMGGASEPAGRDEFLSAVDSVVRSRGLLDEQGYWAGP